MTFCLGMRVAEGLVGIADTRVTTGNECITAKKVTLHSHGGFSFFLMTSGLRSLRDKALTYFEELLEQEETHFEKLYQAVNAFAVQLRRVIAEDREALEQSELQLNLYALVGGQLQHDKDHKLYLLYPQGNWVEIGPGTPYCIIGESGYGKPILDRTLKYSDSLRFALKVGSLAFDSTRISSATVDFPVDVVIFDRQAGLIHEHRYQKSEMERLSNWWQDRLRSTLSELPSDWLDEFFEKVSCPDSVSDTIPIGGAEASR